MLGFNHVVDNVGAGGVAAGVAEPLLADVALDDAGGVMVAAVPARALGQGVRRLRGVVGRRGRAAAATVVMPAHPLGPPPKKGSRQHRRKPASVEEARKEERECDMKMLRVVLALTLLCCSY